MDERRTDRTSGRVRFSLWQLFSMFTSWAIIIGCLVIVFKAQDGRITVLAIICLVLLSWLKIL
jgi:hypothetical protein